jgi:L-asparaginase II
VTSSFAAAFRPVAIASRSGHDESVHFGAAVLLGPDGELLARIGDPDVVIYPRSSNKPLQADAMLQLGAELSAPQLALACASHDGTPAHLEVVISTLASVGLDPSALENTPSLPLDTAASEATLAGGGSPSAWAMNCSGKHAAMLATCVRNGWPTTGYLARRHPLQAAIDQHVDALAGPVAGVGVDGCGAPAHLLGLSALAAAFGRIARAQAAVWAAMTAHPELVGGERRDVTRLMRAVPGLMAKDGAEGVFAAGLPDGMAAAVKIADGGGRAAGVVLAQVLAQAGVAVDPFELGEPVLGHGEPVGRVRPAFDKLNL